MIDAEYDPFNYVVSTNNETQSIIEQTRPTRLGKPIVREEVQISPTSIILMPVKNQVDV